MGSKYQYDIKKERVIRCIKLMSEKNEDESIAFVDLREFTKVGYPLLKRIIVDLGYSLVKKEVLIQRKMLVLEKGD